MQGNAHGHMQLGCGQVHTRDHLCHWVLHLQTGIELQKGKGVPFTLRGVGGHLPRRRAVCKEVLHRARVGIAHLLCQRNSGGFHPPPHAGRRGQHWPLLDDLLVPPLHGAVPPRQGDGGAVLVRQQLHFQVPRGADEAHEEDGRAGHLPRHRLERCGQVGHVRHLADALAASPL